MLSQDREDICDIDGLDDEHESVIRGVDEVEFESDRKGLEITLRLQSDRIGIANGDIKDKDHYDVLENCEDIKRSIAFNYAQFKKPEGQVRSHTHLIKNIVIEIKEIDREINDGDVVRLADHLCNEDWSSEDGLLCISIKLIVNGED
jgi:hypothetical protein